MVTTRKSQDDGYFIVDSHGDFYHLKMVNGQPYCSRIPLPPNMEVIGMNCMIDPDYYGYVYDQNYNIYLLKRSDYGFFQLPIYNYGESKGLLLCYENLFFFTYNFAGGGRRWYYVMDKEHNLLASTSEEYISYDDTEEGLREQYIFPVRASFTRDTPVKLTVKCNPAGKFIWLNLDNDILALDSTTISLSLKLFSWALGKYSRGAVKVHALLDLRGKIPTFIHITDGKYHDSNALDVITPQPEAIYV